MKNNIKKFQEPAGKLSWQHNNPDLMNYKDFATTWLSYRNPILEDNVDEFKESVLIPETQQHWGKTVTPSDSLSTEYPFYDPKTHQITLQKGREETTDLGKNDWVHENTHSLFGYLQSSPQFKKIRQIIGIWRTLGIRGREIYPMLMETRFRHKVNPNHTFTTEDTKEFIQSVKDGNDATQTEFIKWLEGNPQWGESRKNKRLQQITDILNLVADSGEKSQKDVYIAKQGIKLPLYLKYNNYEYAK